MAGGGTAVCTAKARTIGDTNFTRNEACLRASENADSVLLLVVSCESTLVYYTVTKRQKGQAAKIPDINKHHNAML
jgi:hypothetical protein